ncbi:MAG: DUF3999 domain-containing protein, partial [Verrucomicrobia bacterium]|nr:DUF3999 domain-containing protein [Verrucomicrobiota bacterium]
MNCAYFTSFTCPPAPVPGSSDRNEGQWQQQLNALTAYRNSVTRVTELRYGVWRLATAFALAGVAMLVTDHGVACGQGNNTDEARSAWKFRRSVTVAGERSGFAALPLPPEVAAAAQDDLRDLRLIGADGRETPFVVDRQMDRRATREWRGDLVDTIVEKKTRTVWVIDFKAPRQFDVVELTTPCRDFAKRLRVEASDDRRAWRVIAADAGFFDREWNGRIHHNTIEFPATETARYLRVTADDQRTPPVAIDGAVARFTRAVSGERWSREVPLAGTPATVEKISRFRLDVPPGMPMDKIELSADDVAFSRRVTLSEEREVSGRKTRSILGQGSVYRIRLDDAETGGEALSLAVNRPQGGALFLEIANGDSPPLRNVRATVSGVGERLLFPVGGAGRSWTLYYGNSATRAAHYDIQAIKGQLGLQPRFIPANIGAETPNPRYQPVPPLQFVATAGAAVETRQWKMSRRLSLPKAEDIYTVTLAPTDLAVSQPGLADLRIVGTSGRQVPYILESEVTEAKLELRVAPDTRPTKGTTGVVSRYRIEVPAGPDGKPAALPLERLELKFREQFFSRPARLLAPPDERHGSRRPVGRPSERELYAGKLARSAEDTAPIRIGLRGERLQELFLEIEEGDNAPLTL